MSQNPEPIRVSVRLHAVLRRYNPGPKPHQPVEVEVPTGSVVADVATVLGVPDALVWAASVNAESAELDHPLKDGDRVSLFPPVAGGA